MEKATIGKVKPEVAELQLGCKTTGASKWEEGLKKADWRHLTTVQSSEARNHQKLSVRTELKGLWLL